MGMRGVRGAITVDRNDRQEIWDAACEMTERMLRDNGIATEEIGAVIFSMTEDLDAAFPTAGLRRLRGFDMVPLFDARQVAVAGSLAKCIRVLMLVDTEKKQKEIRHVYLRGAARLRPDLAEKSIAP